jgi:putative chitinase
LSIFGCIVDRNLLALCAFAIAPLSCSWTGNRRSGWCRANGINGDKSFGMFQMINRNFFFSHVRSTLFGGHMQQKQVDGITSILDYWELRFPDHDDRWLAYVLATAYHETAFTMQPIEEYGKGHGHEYGRADPVTGHVYFGRGFVQLTWKHNYETMGHLLNIDLVHDPELALKPDVATRIIFAGMTDGLFTHKKLGDYFSASTEDWLDARRIINGLDRAGQIAQYGHKFYAAISYTTSQAAVASRY